MYADVDKATEGTGQKLKGTFISVSIERTRKKPSYPQNLLDQCDSVAARTTGHGAEKKRGRKSKDNIASGVLYKAFFFFLYGPFAEHRW